MQAVSAVFAVLTPQQFAHLTVGATPAHPNAMCIAETLAVTAGEPHAKEFVRQLQNQGKKLPASVLRRCICMWLWQIHAKTCKCVAAEPLHGNKLASSYKC